MLTDAELDHTLGIALLREGRQLPLYATPAVRRILEHDSHLLPTTAAFADVQVTDVPLDGRIPLRLSNGMESGLSVEARRVVADAPRFASRTEDGHTVGYIVRGETSGATCGFFPGCGDLDSTLLATFATLDALLFDGTFWRDDELIRLGIGTRTARELDHIPISGKDGSLERLASLPCGHRIYTHINNTNPVLFESGPERAAVDRAGLTVGFDGLCIEI